MSELESVQPTRLILSFVFLIFALVSPPVQARWATLDDAESQITFENAEVQVKADGSYTETIESKIKVLKESARESLTTRHLSYNSMATEIKIIEAKTIYKGIEYLVDPKLIEDKPLASSSKGFDQQNQILIAYPQVQVKSEVYLKYEIRVKEPPVPGFFSTSLIYGSGSYEQSGRVRIKSELPLYLASNDPSHVLKIVQKDAPSNSKGLHTLEVRLVTPIYKEAVDESNINVNPKDLTWVDISTVKEWPQMARPLLDKYEGVLNQPLPPLFDKILATAKKKTTLVGKINTVTSLLASQINYMGDWRPISGLYIPRNLASIAETKLADCKDFSAATTSILRHLGLKAHIAWVKRGYGVHENPNNLPTLSEFNHAIVRVVAQDQTLWIDPTNFASFAQGIFPDIAERKALVLDPDGPNLSRIPESGLESSQVNLVKNIKIQGLDRFQVHGKLEMLGSAAVPYAGASLKSSKQTIDYGLIRAMGDENRITAWKVDDYDLSSRVAQNIQFRFHFFEKDLNLRTSAGPAIVLSAGTYIPLLLTKTTDRVSDLFLGPPLSVRREVNLEKITRIGTESLNCSIESPWINATREVQDTPDQNIGIRVTDAIHIKKAWISNSELKSAEFSRLQDHLQKCFNGVAIIYKTGTDLSMSTTPH